MTNPAFEKLTQAQRELGRSNFARWDDQIFTAAVRGPGAFFWKQCGAHTAGFEDYLSLLGEAIGRGYLKTPIDPQVYEIFGAQAPWHCVLEYWLVIEVPRQVPKVAPEKRAVLLAKVWNLGESLLQQSPWLDPYILKRLAGQSHDLSSVETDVATWLDAIMQPVPGKWTPPFKVETLDCRKLHAGFLPGKMYSSGPSIICVADRRTEHLFCGLFCVTGSVQTILTQNDLGTYAPGSAPEIQVGPSRATISAHQIDLPHLNHVHSHVFCDSGALVVSALDSQRLWVITSQ